MTSGLVVMAIVNAVNMAVSYALCTGLGPLPELGWTGIALGTAIGHLCGATILLVLLAGGRAGFHLRPSALRPDFDLIRRILRIGVPGGFDVVLVSICHLIYLRIVLSLGDVAAAAHGVAIQVEALGYMPGGAFQISAATMAGQYLGARDLVRARHSVVMACAVASTIMVAAGAFFFVAATPLASFFLGGRSGEVVPLAAQLLRIVAFAMVPLAVVMVLTGALRGAGDTRWPLVLNLVGVVLVRVPLALFLAHDAVSLPLFDAAFTGAGLGIVGAWYAAVIDIAARALLIVARFRHDAWQRIDV
jgi:putative MATE family efflux protein